MVLTSGAVEAGRIRALLERAAWAFPPVLSHHLDGWWLRHVDSGMWWAGTVLPHGDTGEFDLPRKVRLAEDFYADHNAQPRFQVSPGACPAGLDEILAGRGYRLDSPMSLQTASTAAVIERLQRPGPPSRVDAEPTDAWFDAWFAVHATEDHPGQAQDMFRRMDRQSAYASVETDAGVIAVGRAVAETGWAGLFGMATLPDSRGTGAATAVLTALAHWARTQGAEHLYLQVEYDNVVARRLYERAGFSELCRYHYRTAAATG